MPSPFPGMDPYLEEPGLWPDFHGAMLYAIRAALSPLLPPGYLPTIRQEGQRHLQIVDQNERRVVTVVEVLSPSNKQAGRDRLAYLAKRDEYLTTGTNLVEIDLLRAWERLPFAPPLPPGTHYALLVSRADDFPRAGVWPFGVRDPFPTCPVPLRPAVEPLQLALAPCFERVYDEARFDAELDYSQPPQPPLPEPDAAWARELLAARRGGG